MPRGSVVPLSQSAYQSIRSAIVDLTLPPGSFFLDRDVADLVGASRTPIREALARLEVEGWVESVPRKGFRVSGVDLDEVSEMAEMVAGIEAAGCISLATEQDRVRTSLLRETNAQLGVFAEEGNVVAFLLHDDRFHRLTAAGGLGHRLTGSIYSLLIDQLHRARRLRPASPGDLLRHVEEHRLLIMSLELGDAEAAALICRGHRRRMVERLRTTIESLGREVVETTSMLVDAAGDETSSSASDEEAAVGDAARSDAKEPEEIIGQMSAEAAERSQRRRVRLGRRRRSEGG
ncbi:transcriptional regulator, GntR family [Acidimicrobium ferrooxidans DSM 10331]|uniref:Transcriptional regulator, GntR family n=1 Tax=Acidimicrobium ferrooxidans (strain DSM 10331 / JCM 15462 / NBRC 103882 / ICP) TaxID=525909 RepID=C7M287_ACIFD|nr:GntR family transcriptional regulator [Acidimicrobium ferrooxidans]ACU53185.1 transcriptional regulator, GntR family [Acidimicrobium ferrooxidans DSM 10331]